MHPKKLSSKSMDMTTGSTWKLLLSFAVPLLIGNLFQQLYNTVDSLVVGNFVGTEALAAVGSTTSIINTMVMFFNGTSIGASVIISRHYGAHDDKKLHLAVETTIMVTFLASILFTVLGIFLAPLMLRFMSTPDDVLESASVYLRIYFSGIAGLLVYNMGSAVLRAVGDTKRPLLFLCFSSILNTVLDLVFVIVFHLGIAGVAYATIISQFLSAALVLAVLTMDDGGYRLVWKDLSVDKNTLKQILSIGLPAGLQQSLTSFSNVYVQSYINYFGSACMAGWSCYTKIDQFIFLPLQSMNQAATTFVSQNIGARNIPRAKRGSLTAFYMSTAITIAMASVLWLTAGQFVAMFNQDPEVIRYGTLFIRTNSTLTFTCCATQIFSGSLRGAGDSRTPMFIMLFSYVLFRQIYLFVITQFINTPAVVGFGYPLGWMMCSLSPPSFISLAAGKNGSTDSASPKHLVQDMGQGLHGISRFFIRVRLSAHLNEGRARPDVLVIPQSLEIDLSRKSRIHSRSLKLHLKTERQVGLPVGIWQIFDGTVRRLGCSVEKHDLCRGLPVDLRHQAGPLSHPVPVEIQHHLNGRIFLQDPLDPLQGICIGPAPVQLPVPVVINAVVMDHRISLPLQKL